MSDADPEAAAQIYAFGRHVRSLRRVRGLTQEQLGERAGLSADSIRRVERGNFSPTLTTLWKVARGLELDISTLFVSFGVHASEDTRELMLLVTGRPARVIHLITNVTRALLHGLDDE